jgi:hypothetical protein
VKSLLGPIGFLAFGVWILNFGSPTGRYSRHGADMGTIKLFGWLFVAAGVYLVLFTILRRRGEPVGNGGDAEPSDAATEVARIDPSPPSVHDRLRRTRVTGAMAVCFLSLLLGGSFAFAWFLDDGSGNQPFPKGLRRLVVFAAVLHFGSVGYRLVRAAWLWEPVAPIAGKLLAAYALLAATFAAAGAMLSYGLKGIAHFALAVPAAWGFNLLAQAFAPGTGAKADHAS